ncbi:fumarylacetoacetate hydrolase family protein [Sphingomonas morindae]|uniref:Fumarylacetoacetate hydrolase family protein n=1 Tax=Sphingomonas morindae TaxID=1541170 RepID=A0ABY4X7C4_9SPHN|nr:fumarylacetoacetate hydrolase family protein [Sphingomonas morindae]USI72833.1 fumarylacetoacetate hydrolase family protein [Sphingomonas morindae]
MKLARIGPAGHERPVLLDPRGRLRGLDDVIGDLNAAAISQEGLSRLTKLDPELLPIIDPDGVRFGPPVADIGKIVCIGLNYTDHAAEVGLPVPTEPTIFLKGCRPTGANDDVRLPRDAIKGAWEVELGIVIGEGGLYIDEADADAHIAGYCLFNDLSERAYQMERGGQWTKGKSFPGFAPTGPWLVTRDEIADPQALAIWLEVNGHRYQEGSTANLVFGVRHVVAYVSQFLALEAGDLIVTGTPAGVGLGQDPPVFLRDGDTIRLGIDGLGEQRQQVFAWKD